MLALKNMIINLSAEILLEYLKAAMIRPIIYIFEISVGFGACLTKRP